MRKPKGLINYGHTIYFPGPEVGEANLLIAYVVRLLHVYKIHVCRLLCTGLFFKKSEGIAGLQLWPAPLDNHLSKIGKASAAAAAIAAPDKIARPSL
jgi:hypothetical protein